ncbi:MAG: VWA domain-containing protein [Bernardetiaceae bacterium]|nr:VWA domain-containing protein [Bernardetiaceae bacterium]
MRKFSLFLALIGLFLFSFATHAQTTLEFNKPKGQATALGSKIKFFLVADRSGSMSGQPIADLNAALQQFARDMANDPNLKGDVEVILVAFDSNVEVVYQGTMAGNGHLPNLVTTGSTNMSDALRKVRSMTSGNLDNNIVLLLTDGEPDNRATTQSEAQALQGAAIFQAIGLGDADFIFLQQIAGNQNVAKLNGSGKYSALLGSTVQALRTHHLGLSGKILNYRGFEIPNQGNWKGR